MVLAQIVRAAARRHGDRPAFVMAASGATLTYTELDLRSDQLAVALRRSTDLRDGSVAALRLPSHLWYVVAYAALSKLGVAAAGINPSLSPPEQDRIVDRLQPDLVITDAVLADCSTRANPGDVPPMIDPLPERLAAVVFTSGTTGPPKGACFRDRHLDAIARLDLGRPLDLGGTSEPTAPIAQLASTQFAHVGFMTKLPWYLELGLTTHVLDRWRADDVVELIAEHRIATLGAIAPQIALLLRSPLRHQRDLSCLRTLIVGGAASPPALVRDAVTELEVTYSIRYSSTESGGVGLSHDVTADMLSDDPNDGIDTVGRPRSGVEVRLTDSGELCLRSPAVFDGYLHDDAATATALHDGWLHTGDLAELDDAERVRLVGRRSDLYIRGGYNVAPAEVEAILGTHPSVAEVVVVPRPDPVMGEIGVAIIVTAPGSSAPSLTDLRQFASDRLARWKLPEALMVVTEIPLTAVSKPDRVALRRWVAEAPDSEPG